MASPNFSAPRLLKLLRAKVGLNWGLVLTACVIVILSAPFGLTQPPRLDADYEPVPSDLGWWIYPLEQNAFARVPIISSDLNDISISPGTETLWVVGSGGLIMKSENGGRNWIAVVPEALTAASGFGEPDGDGSQKSDQTNQVAQVATSQAAQAASAKGLNEATGSDQADVGKDPGGAAESDFSDGRPADMRDVQFVDAKRGWIATGRDFILHTDDGGETWSRQALPAREVRAIHFLPDGQRGFAGEGAGTIFQTVDGGRTWEQVVDLNLPVSAIRFTPDGGRGLIAAEWVYAARLDEKSSQWFRVAKGNNFARDVYINSQSGLGWAIVMKGEILQEVRSDSWAVRGRNLGLRFQSVWFIPDGKRGWVVGNVGAVARSMDGGQTWEAGNSGTKVDLTAVRFLPDGRQGWAVGWDGTVLRSRDAGASWAKMTRGGGPGARFLDDGRRGWRLTPSGQARFTIDGGKTWGDMASVHSSFPARWYYLSWLLVLGLLVVPAKSAARSWRGGQDTKAGTEPVPGKAVEGPDAYVSPPPALPELTGRFTSDKPLEAGDPDPLNFQAIARTVSLFLRHENTNPPLTLAITGEWGSGKSSLMNLLKADLAMHGWRPVWFNAWHHQKDKHLLAALLNAVRRQAMPQWWTLAGLWVRGKLVCRRLWRLWALATPLALSLVVFAVLASVVPLEPISRALADLFDQIGVNVPGAVKVLMPEVVWNFLRALFDKVQPSPDMEDWGLFAALSALVVLMFAWLARNRLTTAGFSPGRLLASAVAGWFGMRNLTRHLEFRDKFAAEFDDIVAALSRPRLFLSSPLMVFIDDLDRCQPENVVDVLEAVNYLVSSGDCYVVMGMARERVEACIGLSFQDVAKELSKADPDEPADAAKQLDPWNVDRSRTVNSQVSAHGKDGRNEDEERQQRRAYARDYLEKLINIEIAIPELGKQLLDGHESDPFSGKPGAGWLRAAKLVERKSARWMVLALALIVSASLLYNLPEAEVPGSGGPGSESTTLDDPNTESGAGRSAASATVSREKATSSQAPAVVAGGFEPKGRAWVAWAATAVGLTMMVLLLLVEAGRRLRTDTAKDTSTFGDVLAIWSPVIVSRRNTPRSVKRYLNRVRYLSMRLRPGGAADDDGFLARAVRRRYPASGSHAVEGHLAGALPESTLVALSAIEHCDRELLDKEEIYANHRAADFAERITEARPEGVTETAIREIAEALMRHTVVFKDQWPPDKRQRAAYAEIATGVRFSGEGEEEEAEAYDKA